MLTKIIDQANIDLFGEWLKETEKVVIVSHTSPDGDAMGTPLS